MKTIQVKALDNYKIYVAFDDGISGEVDLSDLVNKGIFRQLKDEQLFRKVYTDGSSIAWSDELEIDADNIYAEIQRADPTTLLHTPAYHASN